MKGERKILTASNIKYLLTLKKLNEDSMGIRCVDIAEALDFSKSSVHTMMKTLSDIGFVEKVRYGTVFLTEKGFKFADQYSKYFKLSSNFLNKVFDWPPEETEKISYTILAEISVDGLENMCKKINYTESIIKKRIQDVGSICRAVRKEM